MEERRDIDRVTFIVRDFEPVPDDSPDTRTSIVNGNSFVWSDKDTVGIYPDSGSQVYFAMTSGAGANSASFDGGGWSFKPSSTYYSYYPFIGNIYLDRHHIPVSYLGQKQPDATDIEHIGAYDFLYTPATSALDGKLHFTFSHLNCIIRVTATLPAGTYIKMTVTSPDEDFVTSGYFDLESETPAIMPITKSESLSIDLDNITLENTSSFVVYLMSAPVNLKGKSITVSFLDNDGKTWSLEKTPSRNYAAETIGGLSCSGFVLASDYANGVTTKDSTMEEDDVELTIKQ